MVTNPPPFLHRILFEGMLLAVRHVLYAKGIPIGNAVSNHLI
jgi:hypothetical protein